MGHFKESSYANLLFKNCIILTTITITTNIPTKNLHPSQHTPSSPKKHLRHFCLLSKIGKESQLLVGLESYFWGLGVEFNFQSIGAHYRCCSRIKAAH